MGLTSLWGHSSLKLGASAHACNPSYSGGKNQEDYGSKPAQTNSSQDPISKITQQKMVDRVAQAVERLPA
jgi:hypothetical protein